MDEDFDRLTVELNIAGFLDGFLGNLSTFKLNVAKTATFTIWVLFQFARANSSILGERVVHLLLCDVKGNVADEHICLGVHDSTFLEGGTNGLSVNSCVIYLLSAALSFCGIKELKETIAVLALGLLVSIDDSLVDVKSLLLYMLV